MRNFIIMFVAVTAMALSQGCAMFSSVDKELVAYGVGKAVTMAYLQAQGNLSPQEQDIAVKVWVAFRDNLDQFVGKDIQVKDFPAFIKGYAKQYLPTPSMQDKACSLIDTYWTTLNGKFDLESMDMNSFVNVMASLRNGIQSALPEDKILQEYVKKSQMKKK